ncbi:MAG: RDD family protein [Acidobacteriota bacterium]
MEEPREPEEVQTTEQEAAQSDGPPGGSPPAEEGPGDLAFPAANRWARFFARFFDLTWEILFFFILIGFAYAIFLGLRPGPKGTMPQFSLGLRILLTMALMPVALAFDACVYAAAGNTPGKALLKLHVSTLDGKPLGFPQYLRRNFSMWVKGLALGFPIVTWIAMALQGDRLGKGKQASYDAYVGYGVAANPLSPVRKAIAFPVVA